MSDLRSTLDVAGWEFRRYFKWRQQLSGVLITALIIAGWMGISRLQNSSDEDIPVVAVIAQSAADVPASSERISFTVHDPNEEAELRARVADREVDGLLLVTAGSPPQLIVRREHAWIDDLRATLAAVRRDSILARENIAAEVLAEALAPAELEVVTERPTRTRGSAMVLVLVVSLMLMALMTGMGYIFASITGEKQIRVTEQVLSAIPAQSWIDGKLLGIAGVSVASTLFMVGAIGIVLFGMRMANISLPVSFSDADPLTVLVIIVFALAGLVLWLTFLAAIAAMIDDPHTSTRGSLLLVPMVATGLAFLAVGNPDSGLVRTLAMLPPTSPSTMPARMLLTDVPLLEVALSLVLLIGATILLRVAAGRVFRIAMLMYGKEPTWGEARRWAMEK